MLGIVVDPVPLALVPPMVVVGEVFPIDGVVPEVVFGVVPDVVFGVVPEVVPGVVPVVLLVAPGMVVVVEAPGTVVGAVDGVHRPEVVEVPVAVPTDDEPMVLPVGFVDVLGVVELTGHVVEV